MQAVFFNAYHLPCGKKTISSSSCVYGFIFVALIFGWSSTLSSDSESELSAIAFMNLQHTSLYHVTHNSTCVWDMPLAIMLTSADVHDRCYSLPVSSILSPTSSSVAGRYFCNQWCWFWHQEDLVQGSDVLKYVSSQSIPYADLCWAMEITLTSSLFSTS